MPAENYWIFPFFLFYAFTECIFDLKRQKNPPLLYFFIQGDFSHKMGIANGIINNEWRLHHVPGSSWKLASHCDIFASCKIFIIRARYRISVVSLLHSPTAVCWPFQYSKQDFWKNRPFALPFKKYSKPVAENEVTGQLSWRIFKRSEYFSTLYISEFIERLNVCFNYYFKNKT